jgi:hypothetical protein
MNVWAKVKKVDPPGAEPVRRSEAVVLERERLSQGARGQVPSTCCEGLNDDMKTGASVWWLVATNAYISCIAANIKFQRVFLLFLCLGLGQKGLLRHL